MYLHDLLTSSDDWSAFLERTGGIAPDLIGFGRSGKGVELEYSVAGLADVVEDLLRTLGIDQMQLIGHGWGAATGLELARRRPEQVERLVLLNPLPLVEGFQWPWVARLWRVRVAGELIMGSTQRWMMARELRRATMNQAAWSPERVGIVWDQFDQGTQRAILRLHRSIDPGESAGPAGHRSDPAGEAGPGPGALGPPALVIWGEEDPWFPVGLADAYVAQLRSAELEPVGGAGHWPWLDRPELIDRVARFLDGAG